MSRGENIHHAFWTRADWHKRKIDKLVREHDLSKIVMDIGIHSDLHRFVEPIKPPIERAMSERVFLLLNDMKGSYTPLDAVKSLSESNLPDLSEHLNKQIPFLELSRDALKRRVI